MKPLPWRGTLVWTGTVAAAAAVTAARFAGVTPLGTASPDESGSAVAQAATNAPAPSSSTSAPSATPTAGPGVTPTATAPAIPTPAAPDPVTTQADGTVLVVGDEVLTPRGPLQLAVTFAGHDIVDVQALETPSWERESVELNAQVVPMLTDKAIAADSADIGSVSGATYTSDAYKTSLQSAIDRLG